MLTSHWWSRVFKLGVLVAVLGLSSPKAWSDSVTFSEAQKDSIKCTAGTNCDTSTTGKFTMKGNFFTEQDLSSVTIGTNTALEISVGNWTVSGTFRAASKLKLGQQSVNATFNLTDANSCKKKDVTHGTIKILESPKGLTKGIQISVATKTGSTACDVFGTSAFTSDFAGDSGVVTGTVSVAINIGSGTLATNIDVAVIGNAAVRPVVRGGEISDLNSVTVSGKQ